MTKLTLKVRSVDQVNVEERALRFAKRSIKSESKLQGLKMVASMCDLTTLEGNDTPGKVIQLCQKAKNPGFGAPPVAAVCVYPNMVPIAKECLAVSEVKIAAVATGFPSGQYPLEVRVQDVEDAVARGAHEIDMVINRNAYLQGDYDTVFDEIVAVKKACADAALVMFDRVSELRKVLPAEP